MRVRPWIAVVVVLAVAAGVEAQSVIGQGEPGFSRAGRKPIRASPAWNGRSCA